MTLPPDSQSLNIINGALNLVTETQKHKGKMIIPIRFCSDKYF